MNRRISKQLHSAPLEIRKRYEKCQDIAAISGPPGLRASRGFRDETLSGTWSGHRSSRLNVQYRVIYRVFVERQLFQVIEVTPHNYRKR
ncbi:MAG: type II toxin-antitoxin system mRNA interferase toxin, RelE/StbE family [Gammaproteobacteria bacterium]|nr:MAG: type II toxin-antitoxin system mRNA interferase toxin, RelE/StbE family [Gammaproteobacteria bacterium]